MLTAKKRQNIAVANVTLTTSLVQLWREQTTASMKMGAGFGKVIFPLKDMVEWGLGGARKLLIVQFMKRLTGQFLTVLSWTTSAGSAPALTRNTCGLLPSSKTTTLEKSCAPCSHGEVCRTRQQSTTPDLFIEPPKPQPKQEGFDL